jgi:3-oxoacyl-[acyl-carrier-protein] synthase-1
VKQRVFITGTGIISAIGRSAEETINSLLSCNTGISEMKFLDSRLKDMFPVGEVKYSNSDLADMLSVSDTRFSRTFLLSLAAAREAAGDRLKNYRPERVGFISGNTVGGMDFTEKYFQSLHLKENADITGLVQHDCGYSAQKVADCLNINGYVTTISTACSSSANSIMHGAMLIRSGAADAVLAGGVDSLAKFTLNGFNSLKILDPGLCSPFDENRNGLNLGEGAAYLFLESEKSASEHLHDVICEVKGFGNSCDAFHQTAMSEDGRGPKLAMRGALKSAGFESSEIDYINLHGTGTSNNDLSEGISIEEVFAGNIPLYSSTKSYTGHTLGAAGAVEAVISALTIKSGIIFPNINFKTRMKELSADPVGSLMEKNDIRNVMSNSFGFGGNNSSIIFSKVV